MSIKNTNHHLPFPPGEILRGLLEDVGLSANAAAGKMKIPTNRLTAILNGQRGITPDTSLRLGRLLGGSPDFWYRAQARYDFQEAEEKSAAQIKREVQPLAKTA